MAHLVRCVELSIDHRMGCCLPQVAHPEFSSFKVWRVYDKLLQSRQLVFTLPVLVVFWSTITNESFELVN